MQGLRSQASRSSESEHLQPETLSKTKSVTRGKGGQLWTLLTPGLGTSDKLMDLLADDTGCAEFLQVHWNHEM